jgi:hypothetical protein
VGKPEEKRQEGRPLRSWEVNIKLALEVYTGLPCCTDTAQGKWRAPVNTVMTVRER